MGKCVICGAPIRDVKGVDYCSDICLESEQWYYYRKEIEEQILDMVEEDELS